MEQVHASMFLFAPRPHCSFFLILSGSHFSQSLPIQSRSSFLNSLSFLPTLYKLCLPPIPVFRLHLHWLPLLKPWIIHRHSLHTQPPSPTPTPQYLSLGSPPTADSTSDSPDSPLLINRHLHALSIPFLLCSLPILPVHPSVGGIQR